jgi:hypothetical protein
LPVRGDPEGRKRVGAVVVQELPVGLEGLAGGLAVEVGHEAVDVETDLPGQFDEDRPPGDVPALGRDGLPESSEVVVGATDALELGSFVGDVRGVGRQRWVFPPDIGVDGHPVLAGGLLPVRSDVAGFPNVVCLVGERLEVLDQTTHHELELDLVAVRLLDPTQYRFGTPAPRAERVGDFGDGYRSHRSERAPQPT